MTQGRESTKDAPRTVWETDDKEGEDKDVMVECQDWIKRVWPMPDCVGKVGGEDGGECYICMGEHDNVRYYCKKCLKLVKKKTEYS